MTIIEVPSLNGTPAKADHKNNLIIISKKHFENLDPVYKKFIIAHEEGHLKLNTRDEVKVDDYALKKLLKEGYPLSKILGSLTKVLSYDKANHYGRTITMFDKLFLYDLLVNKNEKLLNHINLIDMNTPEILEEIYTSSYEGEFSDFLGMSKAAKERRQQKHEAKMAKKDARTQIKLARAEKEKAKAEGIKSGTYQPEGVGTGIGKALGGVAQAAGAILGIGKGQEEPEVETKGGAQPEKKDNKKIMTWVLIAVVIIILIVAAYFIFFRKK